jgi:MoaA/NifB/PqqE/SkfB family radical SAM enzyme
MPQEHRLNLCRASSLEHRFCAPRWKQSLLPFPLPTLIEQVGAIDPARCKRLILAGEPLAHPDFDALLRESTARGIERLSLVTDGPPLARPGAVERLVASGVDRVFVVCGGVRRRVYEAVMNDAAFVEALEGIRQAATSPIELHLVVPVLSASEADVLPLLQYVLAMGGRLSGFFLSVPELRLVPPSYRPALLPYPRLARLAERVFSLCQRERVAYGFHEKRGVLPCASDGALDRFGTVFVQHLDALKHRPADLAFDRVDACKTCSLLPACPGVEKTYLDTFGREGFTPVPLDVSMDWRLKPIARLEQRDFKSVSAFDNHAENRGRSLLRINGHCNMSCAFCFIDRTVPDFATDEMKRSIDELAVRNLDHLVLSGGEPTLHPDLPALVAHGRALGFRTIEIQSNGVRAADPAYARLLADAGLNKVTVSLHSVDPEHSDRITRLPGAFQKTIAAMHNFRRLGVLTQVAHVITRSNFQELPATVRFLREEFPEEGGPLSICFGIAQPISDLVYTWVMPRFDEIRPFMREALDYCLEHDVGFGGMIGQGGYPPCMLDGEMRYYERNLENIYRSSDHGEQFQKPPRCAECSFDPWCLGVRRYYVDTYGDEEIRPFRRDIPAAPPPPPASPPLVQLRLPPRAAS